MKSIKQFMVIFVILIGLEQVIHTQEKRQHKKSSGAGKSKQHGEGPRKASQHEKGHEKAGGSPGHAKKQYPPIPSNLINDLLKAIDGIPERSSEKGAKPESQNSKKDFSDKVDRAYKAYKKIFELMKTHSVTAPEDKKIKKALITLFNSRNIKNMVWRVQIRDEKKSGKSGEPSGRTPQQPSKKKQGPKK